MAEPALSITYDALMVEIAAFLGYSVTDTDWTAAQSAEMDRYVQAGVRQFYYPPDADGVPAGYEWSFVKPVTTIDTADGDGAQDLPDDLGRVLGNFHYASTEYKKSIVQVSEPHILTALSRTSDEAPPRMCAVRHKAQVPPAGQRLEVVWFPIPDAVYTLTYNYEAYTGKLTTATNPYPLGGMKHSELITESCLAIAEQRANDEQGLHTAAFFRLLIAGIAQDRRQGAKFFGPMSPGPGDTLPRHHLAGVNYPITYDGVTW